MVVVERLVTLHARASDEVAPAAVAFPQTSLARPGPPSAVWVVPRLRVAPSADGVLLAEDAERGLVALHVLERGGTLLSPVVFETEPVADVLPAAPGAGAWLLGREYDDGGPHDVLRRVDGDGVTVWSSTTPRVTAGDPPSGALERLVGDGADSAFVVARRPRTAVARIGEDGGLSAWRELAAAGAEPVMDGSGRLGWVAIDGPDDRPYWHVLAPSDDTPQRSPMPDGTGGPTWTTVGLDAEDRAYRAQGSTLVCVRPGIGIEWSFGLESVALASDGAILMATQAAAELELIAWRDGAGGESRRLPVPSLGSGRAPAWRLIAARDTGSYVLWGAEGAGGPGVLAEVAADGRVIELTDPAPADVRLLGWSPARAGDWQVDGAGRVYLAVAGPEGVAILRVTHGGSG